MFPIESRVGVRSIGFLYEGLERVLGRAHRVEFVNGACHSATTRMSAMNHVWILEARFKGYRTHQNIHMLGQERMGIVQLVQRNVNLQILL